MPDWLTHVLVMYVLLRIAAQFTERITQPYVAAGMVGGLLPDIAKLELLLPHYRIDSILGIPFSWQGLSWLWGVLLMAVVLSLVVDTVHRRQVCALLVSGGLIHIFLDSLIRSPGRRPATLLRPMTYVQTPEIYLSSDIWPAIIAGLAAITVFVLLEPPPSRQSE